MRRWANRIKTYEDKLIIEKDIANIRMIQGILRMYYTIILPEISQVIPLHELEQTLQSLTPPPKTNNN